jgi:hypothetical protein
MSGEALRYDNIVWRYAWVQARIKLNLISERLSTGKQRSRIKTTAQPNHCSVPPQSGGDCGTKDLLNY